MQGCCRQQLQRCLELTSWSSTAGSHSMSPSMRTANLQVLQASLSVYASWNMLEAVGREDKGAQQRTTAAAD
jgi:hypothetical protein